jgi:hypothetical protein
VIELTPSHLHFSLEQLQSIARVVLASKPEPILAWRLMHQVLDIPAHYPEMAVAKAAALDSNWVHQLEGAQLPDGSFGRFHSQDTKHKTIFRTSEEAIDRAFALGLEASHPILTRMTGYIQRALQGQVHITDPDEKNQAWPLIIRLILAGRLAHIEPSDRLIAPFWQYLQEVTRYAFRSGCYRLEDEVDAYQQLSGVHVPKGFLESQHALWILSCQAMDSQLENKLIDWVWNKPDGIRYVRAPLTAPQPRRIGYWLRSVNILSRFAAWREMSPLTLNRLWESRHEQVWWDFGKQSGRCAEFPLSHNWRQHINRKIDYTTGMLAVLRKCFD